MHQTEAIHALLHCAHISTTGTRGDAGGHVEICDDCGARRDALGEWKRPAILKACERHADHARAPSITTTTASASAVTLELRGLVAACVDLQEATPGWPWQIAMSRVRHELMSARRLLAKLDAIAATSQPATGSHGR